MYLIIEAVADLGDLGGGGGGWTLPLQGFDPLPTQRVLFCAIVLFLDIHFWLTDIEIFLKAPLAPIRPIFVGECAQNFPKNAQKRLF